MSTHVSRRRRPQRGPSLRERILQTARELFYRDGIRAVSVEALAAAAGTNKMTLYRHFASKDALVAEYLRGCSAAADALWDHVRAEHPGDPKTQLRMLLKHVSQFADEFGGRGCPLANAAIELSQPRHPARRVIEEHKRAARERLVALCRAAGYAHPERLADEIFLLVEGARVSLQSVGPEGPGARLYALAERLLREAPLKPAKKKARAHLTP
ncbi:MAG TPA: TetR/AcrR family transcriptional regulator [Burkholderiales bacterium]|nr:TetR/AcrR family transcriptional regulator [Burkholderiales bacterium]